MTDWSNIDIIDYLVEYTSIMTYQKVSKQKILEATAKVIAQKGLDKASVDDIVQKAGIAKGSVYFHFGSKDKLLIAGIRYTAQQRIKLIKKALSQMTSPKDKLIRLFKANNIMLEKDPDSFLMNYALLLSSHKDIRKDVALEYVEKFIEYIAEILQEGIDQGLFRDMNSTIIATTLVIANDLTGIINFPKKHFPKANKIISELFNLILINNE